MVAYLCFILKRECDQFLSPPHPSLRQVKCHQYWPETGSLGLDDMTVTVIDTQDLAYYSIRTFRLSMVCCHTRYSGIVILWISSCHMISSVETETRSWWLEMHVNMCCVYWSLLCIICSFPPPPSPSLSLSLSLSLSPSLSLPLSTQGTERREVKQFHYTGWPDFGVPDHPHPVLSFIRRLNNFKRTTPGPDIAHCRCDCSKEWRGGGAYSTPYNFTSSLHDIRAEYGNVSDQ